jgi:hypothetical protein
VKTVPPPPPLLLLLLLLPEVRFKFNFSGVMHPTKNSPCERHYAGTLSDGTEFNSSYKRGEPTTLAPNQVRRHAAASSA